MKGDLGLGRRAEEELGARVARRRVRAHREAVGRGLERFGLVVRRAARARTTRRAMHERPVRRIHQPDDCVVDRRPEPHGLDETRRRRFGETVEHRDVGRRARVAAEEDPDVALDLARRIGGDPDPRWRDRRPGLRRARGSGCNAHWWQSASHDSSTRSRCRRSCRRKAASRDAGRCRAARRRGQLAVAADQHRLAKHRAGEDMAAPHIAARCTA